MSSLVLSLGEKPTHQFIRKQVEFTIFFRVGGTRALDPRVAEVKLMLKGMLQLSSSLVDTHPHHIRSQLASIRRLSYAPILSLSSCVMRSNHLTISTAITVGHFLTTF